MSQTTVIVYHAVGDCPLSEDRHELYIPTNVFAEQMEYLAAKRRVVPLGETLRADRGGGPPRVAITFDDGYRNVLTEAAPILARLGLPATIFVPSKWIGDRNTWDQPYGCPLDIMSRDELLELEALGVEVQSHGHAHIDYARASTQEIIKDLSASQEILADVLGRSPSHFAYPWGRNTEAARRLVAQAGFEGAWSIEQPPVGNHARARVWIRPFHGIKIFGLKTSGRWGGFRWSPAGRAVGAILRPLFFRRPD